MNINPTFSPALDLLLFLASDYASMYHRAGWTNSSSPIIYAYGTAGHRRFSFFGKALGIDLWNCFVIFFFGHWMSLWETRSRFAVTLYILRTITVVYFKNDFVFAKFHFIFEKLCPVFKIRFYVMISSLNFVHHRVISDIHVRSAKQSLQWELPHCFMKWRTYWFLFYIYYV